MLLSCPEAWRLLWKPPGGRTQPFPSGISPLDSLSDLGMTPGTETAWLLACAASWAPSTLGRQQMPHHQHGDRRPLRPQQLQAAGGQGLQWDFVSTIENGVHSNALRALTWRTAVGFRPPFLSPSVKVRLGSRTNRAEEAEGSRGWAPGIVTWPGCLIIEPPSALTGCL